jgi:hypothetical protein
MRNATNGFRVKLTFQIRQPRQLKYIPSFRLNNIFFKLNFRLNNNLQQHDHNFNIDHCPKTYPITDTDPLKTHKDTPSSGENIAITLFFVNELATLRSQFFHTFILTFPIEPCTFLSLTPKIFE